MKKYEITITDKQTWITPREKRDIDTEDRFEVVVEAKNEDEAYSIAHSMLLDGELDCFDSEYCLSKEGCNWWEISQANPSSLWGIAYETFGDELEFDGGNMYYEIEEIE